MMNLMYGTGGNSDFFLLWTLHIVSVIAFAIGLLFLVVAVIKHLSGEQLQQRGWTLLIVGSIGCLFTIGVMGHAWYGYGMRGVGFERSMPMMWGNSAIDADGKNASQEKEEADGKALYEKLQAKEVVCADLADSDFELIGEYVMGTRLGGTHEQMNERIKQMMGTQGEEQMHIALGKNATGCLSGTSSSSGNGMMNGGMMQPVKQ